MRYKEIRKNGTGSLTDLSWYMGNRRGAGWDAHSDEERMDAIKAALDCGINFIDTAPALMRVKQSSIGETLHHLGARKGCGDRDKMRQ